MPKIKTKADYTPDQMRTLLQSDLLIGKDAMSIDVIDSIANFIVKEGNVCQLTCIYNDNITEYKWILCFQLNNSIYFFDPEGLFPQNFQFETFLEVNSSLFGRLKFNLLVSGSWFAYDKYQRSAVDPGDSEYGVSGALCIAMAQSIIKNKKIKQRLVEGLLPNPPVLREWNKKASSFKESTLQHFILSSAILSMSLKKLLVRSGASVQPSDTRTTALKEILTEQREILDKARIANATSASSKTTDVTAQKKLESAMATVDALTQELEASKVVNQQLQEQIATMTSAQTTELAEEKAKVKALDDQVKKAEETIGVQTTRIEGLTEELKALKAETAQLQVAMTTIKSEHRDQLSEKNATLRKLEEQVDQLIKTNSVLASQSVNQQRTRPIAQKSMSWLESKNKDRNFLDKIESESESESEVVTTHPSTNPRGLTAGPNELGLKRPGQLPQVHQNNPTSASRYGMGKPLALQRLAPRVTPLVETSEFPRFFQHGTALACASSAGAKQTESVRNDSDKPIGAMSLNQHSLAQIHQALLESNTDSGALRLLDSTQKPSMNYFLKKLGTNSRSLRAIEKDVLQNLVGANLFNDVAIAGLIRDKYRLPDLNPQDPNSQSSESRKRKRAPALSTPDAPALGAKRPPVSFISGQVVPISVGESPQPSTLDEIVSDNFRDFECGDLDLGRAPLFLLKPA